MTAPTQTLDVVVVGAGIAGLAAAIALCKAGHKVTLYEKSTFKREVGAAITITPNGNRVLDAWAFDADAAGQTQKLSYRAVKLDTLDVVKSIDFSGVPERFGNHRFNAFHRVQLHEGLRDMAVQAGAQIELGCDAVELDCKKGTVAFDNGRRAKGDVLVLADGVNTKFIPHITGQDIPIQRIGKSIFRTLIPISRIHSDKALWDSLWAGHPSGFVNGVGGKTMFVTYPCASDEVMNCAIFHDTPPHLAANRDWNAPASLSDVLDVLKPLHPCWTQLARLADEWRSYTIGFRDVLPNVVNGKTVMIGDAAHAMQPTHAQGGSMGLEDAAALGQLFSDWCPEDNIERRLRLFEQLRLPRNNTTQVLSNAMFYTVFGLSDVNDPLQIIRRFYRGEVMDMQSVYWSETVQDFFYSYDVFEAGKKALEYKDRDGGIPEGAIRHFGRAIQ